MHYLMTEFKFITNGLLFWSVDHTLTIILINDDLIDGLIYWEKNVYKTLKVLLITIVDNVRMD